MGRPKTDYIDHIGRINYEAVFQGIPVPIALVTPEFVFLEANGAYLRTTGRQREELLGRSLFHIFPDDPSDPGANGPQMLRASFERVLATGETDVMPLQKYSAEVPDEPGVFRARYWRLVNAPLLGPDGRVELIIHRVEEVTGLLRWLRLSRETGTVNTREVLEAVENEVYARTRELQDLNERLRQAHDQQRRLTLNLQEAIERQRKFLSEASHDLRNPITGLRLRLEEAISDPDADPKQVLHLALQDALRLNDLVSDLLELARLDAGTPVPVEPIDLEHLVTEELKRQPLRHPVATHLAPGAVVNASRIRLSRLLSNLLSNADRHARHEIQVLVSTEPPEAVLEVVDDGPGIPENERERIFERFYRSPSARHEDPGGTGLGLAICREIAETYGGRIYATGCPSGGGHLVLRLPLSPATDPHPPPATEHRTPTSAAKH